MRGVAIDFPRGTTEGMKNPKCNTEEIVIEPVFEADFLDCSFGFCPKQSAQQALDKIWHNTP